MRIMRPPADLIRFALGIAMGILFLFPLSGCGGGAAHSSAATSNSPTTSPSGVTGQVSTTHNPQVALYTVTSPKDGTLSVFSARPHRTAAPPRASPSRRGSQ